MWSRPGRPAPADDDERRRARFRALFQAESRALLGYALRRTGRPEDAADVVAEVFLVAWRRVDDVPAGDEARLWLYGVARRVVANHRRGARRRERLGDLLRHEVRVALPPEPDREDATADAVRAALGRVPADDRELLHLTAWEGLTPTQIATVTGAPPATVRTRLHRARRRLRHELEREQDPATRARRDERFDGAGHAPVDHPPLTPSPEEAR